MQLAEAGGAWLKFGHDDLNSNSFGPLVSKEHLESVKNYIKMSEEEGASLLLDGRELLKGKNSKDGYSLWKKEI